MAKAFYSMEEVCELLGKSQDEIKELVRDGSLREFRDAGKIFFKAEDVNKLGGETPASEDSGEITLEAAPEPPAQPEEELPTVADTEGTSVIGLEAIDEPEKPGGGPPEKDTVITASGIGVFDDDELEIDADPMAETQITAGPSEDHVSLEGSGSGSGLLDLTREADDTSLGAELLDEIYPGEEEMEEAAATPEAPLAEEAEEEAEEEPEAVAAPAAVTEVASVAYAGPVDLSEGLFSGLLVGTLILLAVAGSVVAAILQGFFPGYAGFLSDRFWFFLGGAVLVPVLALLIGWVIGKTAAPKRA
jgi:excisionase family DNA binding protein